VERANLAYLLLGAAAAAEARSHGLLSTGAKTAQLASRPAALVWRSPIAAPVRHRAAGVGSTLERDGRALAARMKTRSRQAADTIGGYTDELLAAGIADDIVARLLATGALDRMITVAINHPATDELVANTLDDPAMDRLVARVMDSRVVDDVVARLLESEELQQILDYVTRSPELRAALAHQTYGMAEDVADGVRARTAAGDVLVERLARSLVGRRRQPKGE
jgi:hypothetical protein